MKKLFPVLAAIILAQFAQTIPARAKGVKDLGVAPAAVADPLKALYRFVGVYDDRVGVTSTALFCSSSSTVLERLTIYLNNEEGTIVGARSYSLEPDATGIFTTRPIAVYQGENVIPLAIPIYAGRARIYASSSAVHCSATLITNNYSNLLLATPLHGVRFTVVPGTLE